MNIAFKNTSFNVCLQVCKCQLFFKELQTSPLPAKKLLGKLCDSIRSSDFIVISITRPRGLVSDLPLLFPIIDLPGGAMTSAIGLSLGQDTNPFGCLLARCQLTQLTFARMTIVPGAKTIEGACECRATTFCHALPQCANTSVYRISMEHLYPT